MMDVSIVARAIANDLRANHVEPGALTSAYASLVLASLLGDERKDSVVVGFRVPKVDGLTDSSRLPRDNVIAAAEVHAWYRSPSGEDIDVEGMAFHTQVHAAKLYTLTTLAPSKLMLTTPTPMARAPNATSNVDDASKVVVVDIDNNNDDDDDDDDNDANKSRSMGQGGNNNRTVRETVNGTVNKTVNETVNGSASNRKVSRNKNRRNHKGFLGSPLSERCKLQRKFLTHVLETARDSNQSGNALAMAPSAFQAMHANMAAFFGRTSNSN
jgi:hypothetical protein